MSSPFHVHVEDLPFLEPDVNLRRMLKRLALFSAGTSGADCRDWYCGRDCELDDDSDDEDIDRLWSSSARTSSSDTLR